MSLRGNRPGALTRFAQTFRDQIIAEWKLAVRTTVRSADLPEARLVDHIPELIDEVATIADEVTGQREARARAPSARRHVFERLTHGVELQAIVRELSVLRDCLLRVWARENPGSASVDTVRALDLAIDRAIAEAVEHYTFVRDRTIGAMDTISTLSLEAPDLRELLKRLLDVFLSTTPSVDTAGILLVEDGRLRVRAISGLEEELPETFSLAVGEGFSGTVAAERKPRALRDAANDPLVRSPVIHQRGVQALYAVPLIYEDQLIGVAHMGSVSAREFSAEDCHLFGSMAARATIGIHHHQLQAELRRSEEQLRALAAERERALNAIEALLAASPIAIAFLDRELRYQRVNAALARLDGQPAAAHLGRRIDEMLPPEIAAQLQPALRGVLERGESVENLEVAARRSDATDLRLLASFFPVSSPGGEISGVGGIVVDVTELVETREALRLSEARLGAIVQHAPVAIFAKDASGRVVLANAPLAEVLGHGAEDITGRHGDALTSPEVHAPHLAHDAIVLAEHRAIEVEEVVPAEDGPHTFLTVKFPLPGAHGETLVGAVATDITARKRIEQELRVAVRTREEVLAMVSHDLRNPLATVQLAATMLLARAAPRAPERRQLEMISRSCRRMEKLIDDLLAASSIQAGRLAITLRPEQAARLVAEAVEMQRGTAEEHGVRLVWNGGLDDVVIRCDRDRVLQVFGNLIGNAIKFCKQGDAITLSGVRTEGAVRFTVADTGPGVPSEATAHLFEPYWSAPEHARRGSGLGLYISRGIVEAHGGRIWVEDTPGGGASFSFTLPVAA